MAKNLDEIMTLEEMAKRRMKYLRNSGETKMKREILSRVEKQIIENFKNGKLQDTLIIVLFEGDNIPEYCVLMPRSPEPQGEISLKDNFIKIFLSAVKDNPSIKDGAVMIKIENNSLVLKGFSFRLYPPPLFVEREKNMGSGYNSALDFSGVERVLCVYFINKKGLRKFIKGEEVRLC